MQSKSFENVANIEKQDKAMKNKKILGQKERFKQFLKRYKFLVALSKTIRLGIQECREVKWVLTRSQVIKSYLRFHQIRKLQIGGGPNLLKGWLNTDVYPISREIVFLDAVEPFPFKNSTFDYIFSEHQIEHLTYNEGLFMLRECYRVLKSGGKIRIATPDLETLISLYTPKKSVLQQRYINWVIDKFLPEIGIYNESFVINNFFKNWGHQFIYDYVTLQIAMKKVGFVGVTRCELGESKDENLRGLESHDKVVCNKDMNKFETMILEANRPK